MWSFAQTEPATVWTLKEGTASAQNQNGTYAGKGVAGTPGSRVAAASWTDQSGNQWLFGGQGYDASGTLAYLNDLWEYTGGSWIQKNTASTVASGSCNVGSYGTEYTAGSSNLPGGRARAATWVDSNGNLWLFGGQGCSTSTTSGVLDDLWMYNISTGLWSWEGGSSALGQSTVFVTKGVASGVAMPGSRYNATAWSSSDGTLWIEGGTGYDVNGSVGPLSDLWKYSPTNRSWTWVAGNEVYETAGVYGSQGSASTSALPGARGDAAGVSDVSGNFWLYGGSGLDAAGDTGLLADLWKFDPTSGMWSWIAGPETINALGSYGTEYTSQSGYAPGARAGAHLWADAAGNLWLYGGQGYDANGSVGYLNDLWEYDQSAAVWTWMGGSTRVAEAEAATPTGRYEASGWMDSAGDFWLFGGEGLLNSTDGLFNDLWELVPPTPTPSFSLASGTYDGSQQVTVSEALSDATIYYTTDGTSPSTASTEITAGSAVTVSASETLKAIAVAGTHAESLVRSATYVIQHTPTVNWSTPASITYGTALSSTQLDATASYNSTTVSGTMSYTDVTMGTAIASGTVLTAGTHVLEATFTPSDTSLYKTATAEVTLVVGQATPTVSWATPSSITYGTALSSTQLDAAATYNSSTVSGTYVYSPAAGTILGVGTQTLAVVFYPTDSTDYATVQQTVQLVVTQAVPVINWQTPAAIYYGTALSSTQLDASSTVSGTFVYSPAAGTVLSTGTQTLSVIFTPTDTTDYTTATATVNLTVNTANFAISLSPSSQTIPNGGMAVYVVTVSSSVGVFSSPVTLSISGLPSGATATFSPTTLTPGSSTASGTLTIVTDQKTTSSKNQRGGLPFGTPMLPVLALLAGLGFRRMRRGRRLLLPLLLVVLSLGAALGLTACSDITKSTTAYTLTVTGTADSITNAAVAELLIEK